MKKLSMNSIKGAANVILNSSTQEIIDAVGCTEEEWNLVVSDRPWLGKDRPRVTRILESLLYGMVDTMGLPRFDLPAEYVASMIVVFVSPVNYFPAATWLGSFSVSDDLAQYNGKEEPLEGFEKVKPRQIFAMICEAQGTGICNSVINGFKKKFDLQLGAVIELDEVKKSKSKGG